MRVSLIPLEKLILGKSEQRVDLDRLDDLVAEHGPVETPEDAVRASYLASHPSRESVLSIQGLEIGAVEPEIVDALIELTIVAPAEHEGQVRLGAPAPEGKVEIRGQQ